MKQVLCFGEALIDFLNTGEHQDGLINLKNYRQYPGGAPANACVAVAKLGGNALFAGQVGDDLFGHFLIDSLKQYGVDTRFMYNHPHAKTAMAFVTLSHDGDRSFSFYRDETADVLFTEEQISDDWFSSDSIFHFCSNTLTDSNIAMCTKAAVLNAKNQNAIISFDVNLRHNLWPDGNADIELVNELVFDADIVKFSREELDYLAGGDSDAYIKLVLSKGISLIVITDGEHEIEYFNQYDNQTGFTRSTVDVPTVQAVDTTAGGDSFSGALLFGLSRQEKPREALINQQILLDLLNFATACGAHTVTKQGAYPALPEFDDVKHHWPQ